MVRPAHQVQLMATTAAGPAITLPSTRGVSRAPGALWRLARRKPVGAVACLGCVLLVFVAIFATVIAPQAADAVDPIKNPRLVAPGASHPFGTDNLYRDQFSRVIIGSRISLG